MGPQEGWVFKSAPAPKAVLIRCRIAGGDTASADLNKVMRASYGHEIEYQRLAYEGQRLVTP